MKSSSLFWTHRMVRLVWPSAIVAILAIAASVDGSINNPYTPDANTVFLLHMDEAASEGLAANVTPENTWFIATANPSAVATRNPTPGILGATGASGVGFNFGTCANLTYSNSVGLYYDANGNSVADLDAGAAGGDVIPMSQFAGPNGEFTLEALVKLPSLTGSNREIICMDSSPSPRPFQFRFTSSGQLEFNNIGTTGANPKANIPTTGPEAFVANQWFHVAMTYDGMGTINFYWTKLDNTRTEATLLQSFTGIPALVETGTAVLVLGNENRSTSGEGLAGYLDEVRISKIARGATEMIFNPSTPPIPPSISLQPEDQFLGVGEILVIQSHASGSPTLVYRWQKKSGDDFQDLPHQTADLLSLPVIFGAAGDYRYIVANNYGSVTSVVAHIQVGAVFSGAHPTGFSEANMILDDGSVNPHYQLWVSADPMNLAPETWVPANTLDYNANDSGSKWIAPSTTLGGVRGVYTYRIVLNLDSTAPEGAQLAGSILAGGSTRVMLNGQPTGVENLNPSFPGPHRNLFSFTLTNGFVAGLNTLDFVVDNTSGVPNAPAGNALRVTSLRGIGPALPSAPPTVLVPPQSQTVREWGKVTFSTVATGAPPLNYQWYADGSAIAGANSRTLSLNPVFAGGQGSQYLVVVNNDSGSVTSQVATLTVVPNNQPIQTTHLSVVGYRGLPIQVLMSDILHCATDPDGDPITISTYDGTGTNTSSPATIIASGAAYIYTNDIGFVGADSFNVLLSDGLGGDATCRVQVQVLELSLKITLTASKAARLSWPAAATAQGWGVRYGDLVTDPITNLLPDAVVTEGSDSAVYISPANTLRYYRLSSP